MKHFLIVLSLVLAGCKAPRQAIREVPVQERIKEVDKLVPVYIPADSAVLTALLECDSLNNVQIKELNELKSKGVESKISLSENRIVYKTMYKHDTVYLSSKEIYVDRDVPIYIDVPFEVNKLTTFQTTCMWIARATLLIIGGYILLKLGKIIKI